MSKVVKFEIFKDAKELENEYSKFLGYVEKYFIKDKVPNETINAKNLFKRFYFTIRFLEGTTNAFMIFSLLGIPIEEQKRGKKFLIDWLEEIIEKMKQY